MWGHWSMAAGQWHAGRKEGEEREKRRGDALTSSQNLLGGGSVIMKTQSSRC